jgi:ABC-type transport system involved in cytochrome bd biosynthesis fused ATPase/permease subunit
MLDLLILCLLVASVAWLIAIVVEAIRTKEVSSEPLILLLMAAILVLLGASVPLFFGGVGSQAASVLVLAFGGAILRRLT